MRKPEEQRQIWGDYIAKLRRATGLSREDFAAKLGDNTDGSTIWRWETYKQKPNSLDKPERIAKAYGVPVEEVVAAAGLRPDGTVPIEPTRAEDPEIDRIRRSGLSKRVQDQLIGHVMRERERDEQRRMDLTEVLIRQAGGKIA